MATALDTVAQTAEEKNKLLLYKEAIGKVNKAQNELTAVRKEIKEISFSKGKRDIERLSQLKTKANRLSEEVSRYDRRLLNLEATASLKALLDREKTKAFQKAREMGKQKLAEMRQSRNKAELRGKIQKDAG